MLDSDCQVLRCTWQNISDVNIVEIKFKNIPDEKFISEFFILTLHSLSY